MTQFDINTKMIWYSFEIQKAIKTSDYQKQRQIEKDRFDFLNSCHKPID